MPIFKELKFNYPITVDNLGTKIRISGLVIGKNKVKLSIRSEKTNYLLDHVTGICQYGSGNRISPLIHFDNESKHNILTPNPSEALYKNTLFQKGRFKNIVCYKFVTALKSISLVENTQYKNWFGKYLPQNLITKSIGPRDSFLHSLQACFPHKHLIPVSVESVRINKNIDQHEYLIVTGIEKNKNDDLLEYDLQVTSEDGTVLETWKGLLLKTIGEELPIKEWNPYLLGSFLERKINESEKNLNIRVFLDKAIKKIDNSMYAKQVVSNFARILRRSDNKPETDEIKVSCSKVDNLVLAASSNKDIGCDIAIVENLRWESLLGQKYFRLAKYLSDETGESLEISATMAWTVMESLKKSGKLYNHPVTISSINENFVVFNSDNTLIYSYLANVYDEDRSFIITLAMEV